MRFEHSVRSPSSRRSVWTRAFVLALVLHAAVIASLLAGGAFDVAPLPAAEPDLVRMVFSSPEEPDTFTELPERLADAPPDDPDFLSNVDSRARDLTPEAGDALPHQEGRAEIVQVAMSPAGAASPPPTREPDPAPTEERAARALTSLPLADPVAQLMQRPPTPPQGAADSDIPQEAMRRLTPGAVLGSDISLSTTAWDYGWWVQSFRRKVIKHWNPPSGFRFGLIGGWTLVEIEVARSGELLRSAVLDSDGHRALHESSVLALTRSHPFDALPTDFPDPTLVIRVRMMYSLRR